MEGPLNRLQELARLIRLRGPIHGIDYDPSDRRSCERLADRMLDKQNDFGEFATEERGRNLLRMIGDSFPTAALTAVYFENLEALLGRKTKLPEPGKLLIGLGTGRSGSTTLASLLARIPGACSTHENPPLIFWRPEHEQIEFHIRRFAILLEYFPLVADTSHWWLNVTQDILAHFPGARFVGLVRDAEACAKSFMAIKRSGRGSYNHWVPFGNGVWTPSHWDPTYPTYEVPSDSQRRPDGAKHDLIMRYIREYNQKLEELSTKSPESFDVLGIEDLNLPASRRVLDEASGARGKLPPVPGRLNSRSVLDGRDDKLRF
jgi:hypothetical protein